MGKTKIPWADYSLNPVKGVCPVHCRDEAGDEYCYAAGPRGVYKRFKWNLEVRFEPKTLLDCTSTIKPSRIFVGSTMELFGPWVQEKWIREILWVVQHNPQHTVIFLTKKPENLARYNPWPDNCWVGASAIDYPMLTEAERWLQRVDAKVRFISFEPLVASVGHRDDWLYLHDAGIKWVIVGARTQPYKPPKREWVDQIIDAADKAGIPVFLKPNLYKAHSTLPIRREFPV